MAGFRSPLWLLGLSAATLPAARTVTLRTRQAATLGARDLDLTMRTRPSDGLRWDQFRWDTYGWDQVFPHVTLEEP